MCLRAHVHTSYIYIYIYTHPRLITQESKHWLIALENVGVPCAPVNSVGEVFNMPQVADLDLIQEIPHPTAGSIKVAGTILSSY